MSRLSVLGIRNIVLRAVERGVAKMPYTDPKRKQEWEQEHRIQRLARRRELRSIERDRQETSCALDRSEVSNAASVWAPLAIGGALSFYDPKLAIGAGGLVLLAAAIGKKQAGWWVVGALILIVGCFFYWSAKSEEPEPF